MRVIVIVTLCGIALAAGIVWFVSTQPVKQPTDSAGVSTRVVKPNQTISPERVIDYGKIKKNSDTALADLMKERKQPYGVEQSIDMIVKPDESIKVGDETIPMKKILDQVRLDQGEILETDLKSGTEKQNKEDFGIHVVHGKDNIWDIHFKLLKDYYAHKGIQISPLADEPDSRGRSSGVGKILKFSEHMVHIFNLKEQKLEKDLNQIYPLTKIVVYNMTYIFALLDQVNYADVDRIEFDGEALWLPAEQ
jgi:hypothetical protein